MFGEEKMICVEDGWRDGGAEERGVGSEVMVDI